MPARIPATSRWGPTAISIWFAGRRRSSGFDPETAVLTTVVDGLKGIRCVAADKQGNLYAGLGDPDNQVKVFDKTGRPVRTIGKPGGRNLLGPWETSGIRFMTALKIDPNGKLWVMENDSRPRRISIWDSQTGTFEKEFFGPTDYGAGGGAICPTDPYTMIGHGCEWKISKETGKAQCVAVISRGEWRNARFGTGKDGRVYAAVGGGWPSHLPVNIFERIAAAKWKLRTTISTDEENPGKQPQHISVWSDRNDDQQQQADEIRKYDLPLGGWIDGWYLYFNQAMTLAGTQYRIDVTGWTPCGAPEYDLSKAVKLPVAEDAEGRGGMGAQKGLVSEDKSFVMYNSHYGVEHSNLPCYDVRTGKLVFAYPSNYVGVHGGHLAPPGRTGPDPRGLRYRRNREGAAAAEQSVLHRNRQGRVAYSLLVGLLRQRPFRRRSHEDQVAGQGDPGRQHEHGAARHGGRRFRRFDHSGQRRHGLCPGRQDGLHQLQGERAGHR